MPTTFTTDPLPITAASAGSAPLDPFMRGYLLQQWRTHWAALRYLAPILGFQDRLPTKEN